MSSGGINVVVVGRDFTVLQQKVFFVTFHFIGSKRDENCWVQSLNHANLRNVVQTSLQSFRGTNSNM